MAVGVEIYWRMSQMANPNHVACHETCSRKADIEHFLNNLFVAEDKQIEGAAINIHTLLSTYLPPLS